MKRLLNTLYVTDPDVYLGAEGKAIVVHDSKKVVAKIPITLLDGIVSFGYRAVSPALLALCVMNGKQVTFMKHNGRFLAQVVGPGNGNAELRIEQVAIFTSRGLDIAKQFVNAKLNNQREVLARFYREHKSDTDVYDVKKAHTFLTNEAEKISGLDNVMSLRGVEGACARQYYSVFGQMLLKNKTGFDFKGRHYYPPTDRVNAMLSFVYSLLTYRCRGAIESVGLDPCIGVLHNVRSGKRSLSFDLVEELRAVLADRFVLSMINRSEIEVNDFMVGEKQTLLNTTGRKKVLAAWQKRLHEELVHPYLKEKVEWGMIPYAQALLLARYIRGDISEYIPFVWR